MSLGGIWNDKAGDLHAYKIEERYIKEDRNA